MSEIQFFSNLKYTSREDKPEYVWQKYGKILQGRILDVGADECGLKKFLPDGTKYTAVKKSKFLEGSNRKEVMGVLMC